MRVNPGIRGFPSNAESSVGIVSLQTKTVPTPGADFGIAYDAAADANKKVPVESFGRVVQRVYDEDRAYSNNTGYTFIPNDDTKPTASEGVEILSASITPTSGSNRIRVRAVVPYGPSAGLSMICSIHRDSGDALATTWQYSHAAQYLTTCVVEAEETSPGTSSVTYSVRLGARAAATAFEMGSDGGIGARKLGGAVVASLIVEEIVP